MGSSLAAPKRPTVYKTPRSNSQSLPTIMTLPTTVLLLATVLVAVVFHQAGAAVAYDDPMSSLSLNIAGVAKEMSMDMEEHEVSSWDEVAAAKGYDVVDDDQTKTRAYGY